MRKENKVSKTIRMLKGIAASDNFPVEKPGEEYQPLSGFELELIERALKVEEDRHKLAVRKELDRLQITFSRILMAAAILTLVLILLSAIEIPCVAVSAEYIRLMINAVIVQIAGIVMLGFKSHYIKEE